MSLETAIAGRRRATGSRARWSRCAAHDPEPADPARGRRLCRAVVDHDPQVARDLRRRPPARPAGADDGAQDPRPVPEPLRAQPRRPARRVHADRRHHQAPDEGELPPEHLDRLAVHARADPLDHRRGRRARARPVRQRRRHRRHAGRPLRHRRHGRPALRLRARGDRVLRRDARRLVVRVQVLVPGLDARRRAAHLLRGRAGHGARRRDHHGADDVAHRDRRGPAGHVVRHPAARRVPHLHDRELRGDQPPAVRPRRGRRRARRRLHDRVRRRPLRALLLRRVPERPRRLRDRGRPASSAAGCCRSASTRRPGWTRSS